MSQRTEQRPRRRFEKKEEIWIPKTSLGKRKTMLMCKYDYITVQISNENTLVQIHKPEISGDKVIASAHSRYLISKGWKGSRKNIPAAYLTGHLPDP